MASQISGNQQRSEGGVAKEINNTNGGVNPVANMSSLDAANALDNPTLSTSKIETIKTDDNETPSTAPNLLTVNAGSSDFGSEPETKDVINKTTEQVGVSNVSMTSSLPTGLGKVKQEISDGLPNSERKITITTTHHGTITIKDEPEEELPSSTPQPAPSTTPSPILQSGPPPNLQSGPQPAPQPPPQPGPQPLVHGFAALMGDVPDNADAAQGNSMQSLPPVSIGTCLLCGNSLCGANGITCASDDEEEADPKRDFLPPPPLSSVEVDKLFSKLLEQDKETPMEPCSVISTEMYLHQKQALQWMVNRENSKDLGPFWKESFRGQWYNEGTRSYTSERPNCIKGGILADDMGLGKTLTIIALIFTNHINGKPLFLKKEVSRKRAASAEQPQDSKVLEPKKPCLNISSSEDELHTPPQSGNSCTSTSESEDMKPKKIKKEKDIVAIKKRRESLLSTKKLHESKVGKNPGEKFRKLFLPSFQKKKNKVGIKKEKSVEKPTKLNTTQAVVNIDDDDDDLLMGTVTKQPTSTSSIKIFSTNPANQDVAKATLIICPLSVLSNWTDQICAHVNPAVSLRVYLYYGAQRIKDIDFLKKQDIVLTTYPTIANDFRSHLRAPLHKIKWLRIILDEGHTIRNKATTLSKAVLDLEGERRWVITGTPIQNRIDDLWVLLLFLRLEPFNDKKWWKIMIANILQKRNLAELADFRLNTLIKHISIRRLKDEKVQNIKLVELPPKHVVIQDIELSEEERKLYDMLQLRGQKTIRRYMRENTVIKHYAHCFFIIMRLRQMCLYPELCNETLLEIKSALQRSEEAANSEEDAEEDKEEDPNAHLIQILLEAISAGDGEECAICLESLTDPVVTQCAHVFCSACIMDALQSEGLEPVCPMCRAAVSQTDLVRVPEEQLRSMNEKTTDNEKDSEKPQFEGSAKITALLNSLETLRDKDPSIKSVVISQFTSFLNVIADHLERRDFRFLRLDGKMNINERTRALQDFNENDTASVFLLSMTAGGTGISLTAASRVFLMDPAWNPAVEEQCFDRCHRMGQTKEVIITKYVVTNSIEERMLTLQDQKRALMTDAFGAKAQSEEDRRRTRVRDIAHLMGLQHARPAVART